jgi:hypothetical protein
MQITGFDRLLKPYLNRIMIDEETWQQIYLAYLSTIGIKFVKWEDQMQFCRMSDTWDTKGS